MKSRSPAVSVIIPTFNRAAMLSATLESFAAQSIAKNRYEVVVVDDGIADRRLLEEHLKSHKQYPQESVAILGYTTWAPTLSVTPLMRYVTDIRRFLFAYGDLKDGQVLDFTYFWAGRSACKRTFHAKRG